MTKITPVLLALCLLPGPTGFSQSGSEIPPKQVIDSIAGSYIKKYSLTGLSIGVVAGGNIFTYAYGYTGQSRRYPVTDSTLFHQASVSKLFTSLAVMQLVEKGKLRPDDAIKDILPEFKMRDRRSDSIRVRHLLTHSSGLKWDNLLENSPDDTSAIPAFIDGFRHQKLNFSPGAQMSYATYSNAGFDLLGIIVERISGLRFDDYVRQYILRPAAMHRSRYNHKEIAKPLLAWPQIVAGKSKNAEKLNAPWKIDSNDELQKLLNAHPVELADNPVYGETYEHNPSGNLISNPAELSLWMKHLLEIAGGGNNQGIIGRQTLLSMWEVQKKNEEKKVAIGWGWWIRESEHWGKMVFHVGSNPGFCSIVALYPEKNFGICISANSRHAQRVIWQDLKTDIENKFAD